jgi:hypothetical protein
MSQIGSPQKNILEPIAGGYPSTTPAAAGKSALLLGQTLVDDANQETGGRDASDLLKVPKPYRVGVGQPDLPKANTQKKTIVPNGAVDANGNRIVDSDAVFSSGTNGGAFDGAQKARARALDGGTLIENAVIPAAPLTIGFGAGYGAMSGGTPAQAGSGAYGGVGASQASFAAINRTGSRNHASVNVIHRPGDNQAAFLY